MSRRNVQLLLCARNICRRVPESSNVRPCMDVHEATRNISTIAYVHPWLLSSVPSYKCGIAIKEFYNRCLCSWMFLRRLILSYTHMLILMYVSQAFYSILCIACVQGCNVCDCWPCTLLYYRLHHIESTWDRRNNGIEYTMHSSK